jgi:UDP-glucose 4-epimerase
MILVTGGCGFIGSNLVDELIEQGREVCVIDLCKPNYKNNKASYYIMDIASDDVEQVFAQEKPDYVIHLAAQASVSVSVKNPKLDCMSNIYGTLNIIENCKKYNIKKLIAASTAAIYGAPQYLPVDEIHELNPTAPYGLSKKVMEEYIQMSGLDYVIFRFSNVYGPRQAYGGEAGVVSIFINNLLQNKEVVIFGDGEQYRDFIYVKDLVKCIIRTLDDSYKKEIFNLSTQTKISINELLNTLKIITGSSMKPIYKEQRPGDIKESILCNKKMLEQGFVTNISLLEGLKETFEFFNQQYIKNR